MAWLVAAEVAGLPDVEGSNIGGHGHVVIDTFLHRRDADERVVEDLALIDWLGFVAGRDLDLNLVQKGPGVLRHAVTSQLW